MSLLPRINKNQCTSNTSRHKMCSVNGNMTSPLATRWRGSENTRVKGCCLLICYYRVDAVCVGRGMCATTGTWKPSHFSPSTASHGKRLYPLSPLTCPQKCFLKIRIVANHFKLCCYGVPLVGVDDTTAGFQRQH